MFFIENLGRLSVIRNTKKNMFILVRARDENSTHTHTKTELATCLPCNILVAKVQCSKRAYLYLSPFCIFSYRIRINTLGLGLGHGVCVSPGKLVFYLASTSEAIAPPPNVRGDILPLVCRCLSVAVACVQFLKCSRESGLVCILYNLC